MNTIHHGQCSSSRLLLGFLAGFFSTLIFHQLTLAFLWAIHFAPFKPFSLAATAPLGIPVVFSLAFWGGVWGVIFALVDRWFPDQPVGYHATGFIFGAIFPSLVAWLVVLPLKGNPMGGGWYPSLLITGLLVNGAWGIGTGLFLDFLTSRFPSICKPAMANRWRAGAKS